MNVFHRLADWLETAYRIDDAPLGLARIAFASYLLLVVGVPSFTWIADAPDFIFNPPVISLANLLGARPPAAFLYVLSVALLVGFLLLLFGIWTRFVSVLVGVLLLIGFNLSYSFGKLDHDILLALTPLAMSISGWGNAYSLFPSHRTSTPARNATALGIVAILLGFAMLAAAYPKVRAGWLDPSTQAVYGHLIENYYVHGRHELLASLAVSVQQPIVWEAFDYGAVLFEGLFFLAVWRPTLFSLFLFGAVFFHLVNLLVLNIGFSYNIAVYALFAGWYALFTTRPAERIRLLAQQIGIGRSGKYVMAAAIAAVVIGVWLVGTLGSDLSLRANPSILNLALAQVIDIPHEVAFHILPITAACVVALVVAWVTRSYWLLRPRRPIAGQ